MENYKELYKKCAKRLLQMHYESKACHIGSNLSCLDILLTLYHDVMNENDQLILSKGHSAGALYIALWSKGLLTDDDLKTFHQDGTRLAGHPSTAIPGVVFATGSLGHGLGLGAGLALAKKIKGESGRVFVVMSDSEWQEGSYSEATEFIFKNDIYNLFLIVDNNGIQGISETPSDYALVHNEDNIKLHYCNGHVNPSISSSIKRADSLIYKYINVINAQTVKGKGISFMENTIGWHYWTLNKEQYEQAIWEIDHAQTTN